MFAKVVAVYITSLRARDAVTRAQSICLYFLTFSCRKCARVSRRWAVTNFGNGCNITVLTCGIANKYNSQLRDLDRAWPLAVQRVLILIRKSCLRYCILITSGQVIPVAPGASVAFSLQELPSRDGTATL